MNEKKREKTMRRGNLFLLSIVIFMCFISFGKINVKASTNITIGGVDLGYSEGSYFSKNGSACKCHGRGTCGEAADCNCIVVSGTSQCYGWSMWVENKLFGYNEVSNSKNFTTVITNYSNCTGSGIYNKLNGRIGAGTHIRTSSSKKGYSHSVSVISYDQNGINITDCNHSGKCQVDVRYYSWDSFASFMNGYGGISFVKVCKNGNLSLPDPSIAGTYWGSRTDTTFRPVAVINNPETVKEVKFAVWSTGDQSDIKWYDANYNGEKEYFKDISINDFNNNIRICHVYVYGYNGSLQTVEMERFETNNYSKPSIEGVYWGNATNTTFRPVIVISDPALVSSVRFAVWSTGDQSDIKWYDANYNGVREYFKDIKYDDFTSQRYLCHAYVYGKDGSTQSIALNTFDTYDAEGNFEGATGGIGSVSISGWAFDRSNNNENIYIHCSAKDAAGNETFLGTTLANLERSDVNNAYSVGNFHGFSEKFITSLSGTYTIEASAINIGGGKEVTFLGSKKVTIAQPTIYFDSCGGNECEPRKVVNTENYGTLPEAARSGYKFDGWYTEKENGQRIAEDDTVMLVDDQTLYAHWIKECEHINVEIKNRKEPTCTAEGYSGDTYCKDCGTLISAGSKISRKEHNWWRIKVTQEPTCTMTGTKTYTCAECLGTKTEEIPATGHENKITKFAKEASCKSDGYTGDIYCEDCGKLIEEGTVIPKSEHLWNAGELVKSATCTEEGEKIFTCTVCGNTRTETISATGHGTTEIRNKKEASCSKEGYTGDTYCTVCNQKISSGSVVAKMNHSWDAGKITRQPTTTEAGIKTYTCRSCEATRTETIAKLEPQTATSGKTVKDKASNGVYKVLKDGLSVEFTKPISKKTSAKIPNTIKVNGITCKVTGISANAFKNNITLKTVTIGRNVTTIGTNAFYGCKKLSKISGGNGIVKINAKAFANCGNLSSITIPGTVRSIGKQAFYNCKKLRTITIKTSTLSSKTIGSKAFTGTYKKPTVKVPAKQINAYKKLLKSRGMSSKAVYKK